MLQVGNGGQTGNLGAAGDGVWIASGGTLSFNRSDTAFATPGTIYNGLGGTVVQNGIGMTTIGSVDNGDSGAGYRGGSYVANAGTLCFTTNLYAGTPVIVNGGGTLLVNRVGGSVLSDYGQATLNPGGTIATSVGGQEICGTDATHTTGMTINGGTISSPGYTGNGYSYWFRGSIPVTGNATLSASNMSLAYGLTQYFNLSPGVTLNVLGNFSNVQDSGGWGLYLSGAGTTILCARTTTAVPRP